MKEFEWQEEALKSWIEKGERGTIEAATGSGKTNLAIKAIKHSNPSSLIITVPTIHLQKQWQEELEKHFPVDEIGLVGNGQYDFSKRIVVGVVNSLWDKSFKKDMLIIDESHHGPARKSLDFLRRGIFQKILCLSATPERADGAHEKLYEYAPVVFRYKQKEAIEDKVLCEYDVINIGLKLNEKEQKEYDKYQKIIDSLYPIFGNNFDNVTAGLRGPYSREAAELLKAINIRKKLLTYAQSKAEYCPTIVVDNSNGDLPKTIIFCEFIDSAEYTKQQFDKFGLSAAIYHSRMSLKERKKMLQDFREDKFKVMISARALDEGVNIPEAEIAIWSGGNRQKRQLIQRLGRVLRAKDGKVAKFYHLYIRGTTDEWAAHKRAKNFYGVAKNIEWK